MVKSVLRTGLILFFPFGYMKLMSEFCPCFGSVNYFITLFTLRPWMVRSYCLGVLKYLSGSDKASCVVLCKSS